jgi:hypothetical protein
MAIAIAVTMSLTAVLSALPATAVSPDCTKDFDIVDSEALASERQLGADASETGLEDAIALDGDENVTVELRTNDDELELGIFEDNNGCERSTHASSNCDSDVLLDTTGSDTEDSQTCTIEAPNSGSRDFYFVFENVEMDGDPLKYKVYVSS